MFLIISNNAAQLQSFAFAPFPGASLIYSKAAKCAGPLLHGPRLRLNSSVSMLFLSALTYRVIGV